MQREIKFRTYDKDTRRFHFWGFVRDGFSGPTHTNGVMLRECEQFTGLLDRNGKEIFEGDLVQSYKVEYPSRMEVKDKVYSVGWGLFGFTLKDPQNPNVESLYLSPELLEVIGNVNTHSMTT